MEWHQIGKTHQRPTKAQRHALYRLGFSRWIVKRMTSADVTEAIAFATRVIGEHNARQPQPQTPPPTHRMEVDEATIAWLTPAR